MHESPAITNKTSLEIDFKCQSGLWYASCTNTASVNATHDPFINYTGVMERSSTTGLLNELKSGEDFMGLYSVCDQHSGYDLFIFRTEAD